MKQRIRLEIEREHELYAGMVFTCETAGDFKRAAEKISAELADLVKESIGTVDELLREPEERKEGSA